MKLTWMIVILGLLLFGCTNNAATGQAVAETPQEPQIVSLGIDDTGFTPNPITLKVNQPVSIRNDGTLQGCGLYPLQPELGINADFVKYGEFLFTPTEKGSYTLTCSMGMFKTTINVV